MARTTQMLPGNDGSPASFDANDATPPPPTLSSAPYGLQFGLGRHRRLLNSQTRSTATNIFNPEAVEFIPSMPTKRKASTSATPGKSRLAIHDAAHEPLIKAKDLFATADTANRDRRSATLERLLTDLATEGDNVRQTVSQQLPPVLRRSQSVHLRQSRLVTDPRVVDKTPSNLSVILSRILASSNVSSHVIWPSDRVPAEMFDQITLYLARDDVKSMRLVNHEFERKVSRSLFHTAVVPFNTELYDMVGDEARTGFQRSEPEPFGKGKARATPDFAMSHATKSSLHWRNAKEDDGDKIYRKHGLRVFQGFGPHIRRFGMSFEVSENQLLQLPIKKELDHVDAYYGDYDWPPPHYTRFDRLAGLEHTADETSRMKSAFDKLEIVQELALSVDSGLGYMNGPDLSLHARVFRQPAAVFGSENVSDHEVQAAVDFWAAMQQSQRSFTTQDVKEVSIAYRQLDITPAELDGLEGTVFADTRRWSSIDAHRVLPDGASVSDTGRLGVLYTNAEQLDILTSLGIDAVVIPNDLRKEQKEWLLETEWAQRAFLESYMLAVIDNPSTFENVTCLNIARLSSGFLSTITQQQFWDALPSLQAVTLLVSPHWRSVGKDNAGQAETTIKNPSAAVTDLYNVLRSRLSRLMLKKLNIGWVDGGEHAPGMLARNANILPAPIIQLEQSMAANAGNGLLIFEHVEELTLTNCWMTPVVLEDLVRRHAAFKLRKLVLSSVSLTAHPRATAPAHPPAAPHLAHAQIHQQQPQHMNFGIPPWMNGMHQPMNTQQLAHMQQQWQHLAQLQHQATAGHPGANAPMVNPNLLPHPFTSWVPLPALPTAHTNSNPPAQPHHPDPSLLEGHREGSWPSLLARIFPSPHHAHAHAHDHPPPPPSNLKSLTLISCGYLRLNTASFNQSSLSDPSPPLAYTPWFRARHATLKPFMLESKDRYLGTIVQFMPLREVDAMHLVWGFREGWEDGVKAAEAEFDGLARGGTGRISGTVRAVGE
ncbi:hypothetical protein LTR91_008230 [Friedmanniomyces endolithicus]|uniref:F-box domain-containing protein n=1 Tax=Friedmanniomyces endolithicus TaxID=329885 RepID=A0AAN6KN87_9PEZI|nr:hypothetical protein LTR94_012035 [Friedmanniomyces endolithicus]KAK0791785.1 hypothetical protein LTR38_010105 [Friedmanniomyces endolithicus]KAK0801433.1 hypothetical protein LTR75_008576 [Friedmanniomyces endolithicus]KAK0838438.1 hypothetical protein LTR03_012033 [Friedmanniomyces endolithicus]KAK0918444.1 hypothetical protein LTR57_011750 [Friedmanniomyces endolithicus]